MKIYKPPLYDWFSECVKYSVAIVLLTGFFIGICNTIILLAIITTVGACPEKFHVGNATFEIQIFYKNMTAENVVGWFISIHVIKFNVFSIWLGDYCRFTIVSI